MINIQKGGAAYEKGVKAGDFIVGIVRAKTLLLWISTF